MGYTRKCVKGKGEIYTFYEFQGVGEKFEQMKFLAAIFEMQILKRDTIFHFRNFMNSKNSLLRDFWLSISAANIGNVAAWCAHSWSVLRLLSSCASVRLVRAARAHPLVSSHHVACNLPTCGLMWSDLDLTSDQMMWSVCQRCWGWPTVNIK